MKAISLWNPWAELAVIGYKGIETRGWPTKVRGEIAIHATQYKKLPHEVYASIASALRIDPTKYNGSWLYYLEHGIPDQNFGSILGTVNILDCVPIEQLYGTEYDTPKERACGDWSPGRYGWILAEASRFSKPIPAKGRQGF
jgi:hypothetical protein